MSEHPQPDAHPLPMQAGGTPPQPQPLPLPAPAPAGPAFLNPGDAEKSRRWRITLSISSLVLALIAGFYAVTNTISVVRATNAIEANGGYVPQNAMAAAISIIVVFGVIAVAYAAVGIWNIVARKTMARAPLIAAIVLAAVVFVLIVLFMTRTAGSGYPTQIGGLALNALIITRAIIVLRMKKATAPFSAAP